LKENKTFDLVELPEDKRVIRGKWVYAKKIGPDNGHKYKARYVEKGYSQVPNTDFNKAFLPTARITSIRMLMQFYCQESIMVHQTDVKTACFYRPMDCELYMGQPEGYSIHEKGGKLVWKLNRSLYGLNKVEEIGTAFYILHFLISTLQSHLLIHVYIWAVQQRQINQYSVLVFGQQIL